MDIVRQIPLQCAAASRITRRDQKTRQKSMIRRELRVAAAASSQAAAAKLQTLPYRGRRRDISSVRGEDADSAAFLAGDAASAAMPFDPSGRCRDTGSGFWLDLDKRRRDTVLSRSWIR
jgi:hypothetical protein